MYRFQNANFLAKSTLSLLLAFVSGCAGWTERTTDKLLEKPAIPKLNESKRSLILNVQFIPIEVDETSPDEIQSLWQWIDETHLDVEKRRQLVENGIRVGRVVRDERFRQRLATMTNLTPDAGVVDQFFAQADIASEVTHGDRRIPMRMGSRYELPLRQPIEGSHTSMVRANGKLVGRTLVDPQYLFAVTPTSGSNVKEVQLRLRPEIQHGSMRQRWVSSDTALRIDTRRESWSIEELDLKLVGTENDTFVIGATTPRRGLGKQLLGGKGSDNSQQQVLVLITLAHVPLPSEQL